MKHNADHMLRTLSQDANAALGRPITPHDGACYSNIGHVFVTRMSPEGDCWGVFEVANIYGAYTVHYAAASTNECATYLRGMIAGARGAA